MNEIAIDTIRRHRDWIAELIDNNEEFVVILNAQKKSHAIVRMLKIMNGAHDTRSMFGAVRDAWSGGEFFGMMGLAQNKSYNWQLVEDSQGNRVCFTPSNDMRVTTKKGF